MRYTFNNPNSLEDTIEMLVRLFVEANKLKVHAAVQAAMRKEIAP